MIFSLCSFLLPYILIFHYINKILSHLCAHRSLISLSLIYYHRINSLLILLACLCFSIQRSRCTIYDLVELTCCRCILYLTRAYKLILLTFCWLHCIFCNNELMLLMLSSNQLRYLKHSSGC